MATSDAVDLLATEVDAIANAPEPADLETVVLALRDIHAVMAQFREARDQLATYGAGLMPQRQMNVAGLPIERTGGWDRSKWQHDLLLPKLVQWARDDRSTYAQGHEGELPDESEGQTVVALLQKYASLAYWKVTAARDERGLDVDDYCEKKPARPGIKMPRGL